MLASAGLKATNDVFNGNLNTALTTGTSNTDWDIQISLDTTTTLWSVEYGVRVAGDVGAFTANPTINYVGISANNTGNFDSFSLTVMPEPGTYVLLSGLGYVLIRRRKR